MPAQFHRTKGQSVVRLIKDTIIDDDTVPLNLLPGNGHCVVTNQTGQHIALLNKKASLAFGGLVTLGQFELQGFAKRSQLQRGLAELEKHGQHLPQFDIDINVHGPVTESEKVAKVLSSYRLYLQHPYTVPESRRYANPQYLEIQDEPLDAKANEPAATTNGAEHGVEEQAPSELSGVLTLLDNLPRHKGLTPANADACVKTVLLA